MAAFPRTKNYEGYFAPVRAEVDVHDLIVTEGAIPRDISGAFHRVAPDPHFPPKLADDIWFNGDGMVTLFRFHDGTVHLKQRWIHTDKFQLESAAGRALFGAYRNPLTDDPSVAGRYRGTANTNVVVHAGKLLALKEDSPPVAMDPLSLDTLGNWNFDGGMTSPTFTAHPKLDPHTGEMIAFGYATKGLCTRDMVYYVIDASGKVTKEVSFEAPYYCMMHDFGVTRDYAVFHVVPIVGSWERLKQNKPHFGFDRSKEIYLGVLPRAGRAADIRWFRGPNQFASHVMNAYNIGTRIYFDTPVAKGNGFPFFPDTEGAPFDPVLAQARLTRWSVDMAAGDNHIEARTISNLIGEFPRIDDRFAMAHYRHGYMLTQDASKPFDVGGAKSATGLMMNTLTHLNVDTGDAENYWIGPVSSLQEPCFIPRRDSDQEGDGYVVIVENKLAANGSALLLFDAQNISAGPIARIDVPLRLRPALHGNWTPAEQLRGRA